MAIENITLNIIPTGDTPSIHVAQFDIDRPFNVTLKEGEDDFTPTGYDIELQVRKVDSTIVTVVPLLTTGNVVTFGTTEQMTACSGTNIAELQLTKDSQTFATLHFYLVVQRDVLAGGVTSESDIYNLTEQIAEIVPEVIGDDYYNKEEVDEKIAEIPTFDPTNYYDKSDVNALLNEKADVSDLPDMSNYYNKSETDTLLSAKANTSDLSAVAFSGDYDDLLNKPVIPIIETATIENDAIVTFSNGADNVPVKELIVDIDANAGGISSVNIHRCGKNLLPNLKFQQSTQAVVIGWTAYAITTYLKAGTYTFSCDLSTPGTVFGRGANTDSPFAVYTTDGTTGHKAGTFTTNVDNLYRFYVYNPQGFNASDITNFQIEIGNIETTYNEYVGIIDTIALGETLTQGGILNVTTGLLTRTDETTSQLSATKVYSLLNDCVIFADTGNINKLVYFKTGCESIAELIKAFM